MRYERDLRVLRHILEATRLGLLTWKKERDAQSDWYSAELGEHPIQFRFLYYEATNQVGADPGAIDFHMYGMNARFAFGTEGWSLVAEILAAAFPYWHEYNPDAAEEYLLRHLPQLLPAMPRDGTT